MKPGKVSRMGKVYNVKLKFSPEVARSVTEVQWHCTQKVAFDDDGSTIIKFRVDSLNEIIWWVLSYGNKVQILAPKVLRKKIIKIARNKGEQNK